jgi:hypothetical protein
MRLPQSPHRHREEEKEMEKMTEQQAKECGRRALLRNVRSVLLDDDFKKLLGKPTEYRLKELRTLHDSWEEGNEE